MKERCELVPLQVSCTDCKWMWPLTYRDCEVRSPEQTLEEAED